MKQFDIYYVMARVILIRTVLRRSLLVMDNRYSSTARVLQRASAHRLIALNKGWNASCFRRKLVLVEVTLVKPSKGLDNVSKIQCMLLQLFNSGFTQTIFTFISSSNPSCSQISQNDFLVVDLTN